MFWKIKEVNNWIDDYEFKNRTGTTKTPHKTLRSTKNLPDKERKDIIKFAEKEGKSGSFIEEQFVPVYKKSDEPTKKALLSGRIKVKSVVQQIGLMIFK